MTLNSFIYRCLKIENSYGGKHLFACILLRKLFWAKHFCPKEGRERLSPNNVPFLIKKYVLKPVIQKFPLIIERLIEVWQSPHALEKKAFNIL